MSNTAILAFILVTAAIACGQNPVDRQEYNNLDRRIFFHPDRQDEKTFERMSPSEVVRARGKMHDIVTRSIRSAAMARDSSAASVQKAITVVQGGKPLLGYDPSDQIEMPYVDMSDIQGFPTMVAAFAVLSGGAGIPDVSAHIQFYFKVSGAWGLVAERGDDFGGCGFAVAALRSPVPGEVWYLAWGKVIGDTGARLKMRVYAFNGGSVRTVWQKDGLFGGSVEINRDQVILHYLEPPPEGVRIPPQEITVYLRPTIHGLEQ